MMVTDEFSTDVSADNLHLWPRFTDFTHQDVPNILRIFILNSKAPSLSLCSDEKAAMSYRAVCMACLFLISF